MLVRSTSSGGESNAVFGKRPRFARWRSTVAIFAVVMISMARPRWNMAFSKVGRDESNIRGLT